MSFFSSFKKATPADVYQEIAQKIVSVALQYRATVLGVDNLRSTNAGAEVVYFLLHMVDRVAFEMLGPRKRDEIIDELTVITIQEYCKAIFVPTTPQPVVLERAGAMVSIMNERQHIYGQVKTLAGNGPAPSAGTLVFAVSYYIHQALRRTSTKDVTEILCGRRKVTMDEIAEFPDPFESMRVAVFVAETLKALRIDESLKKLR